MTCKQCEKEFDRIVSDHTTKEHLQEYLDATLSTLRREDYNHGASVFRKELENEVEKLENQIKELKE